MRNLILESKFCEAIKNKNVVRLSYKNEFHKRTFEPYILFESSNSKFLIYGIQTKDDSKPFNEKVPHKFEVALVNTFIVTNDTFRPDSTFNSFTGEYGSNIICSIDRIY